MSFATPTKQEAILLALFFPIALGLLNALYLPPLYKDGSAAYWTADILQYVVVPASAFVYLVSVGKIRPSEFGFHRLRNAEDLGLVLVVIGSFWLSYAPVRHVAWAYLWAGTPADTPGLVIPKQGVGRWAVITYFSISAAVIEEVVYRALPWLYFSLLKMPVWLYVLSTALLFGAIHSEQGLYMVVATFSLGLAAGMLYARVQNVWPFIIAHFVIGLLNWSGNDF